METIKRFIIKYGVWTKKVKRNWIFKKLIVN